MKNEQIATAFQNNEKATNSNNSFFVEIINGVTIAFSYGRHFPIAVKFNDGVLFNTSGYSNTTTRHKNLILSTLGELNDDDKTNTEHLSRIVDGVRFEEIKTKAELIEKKI